MIVAGQAQGWRGPIGITAVAKAAFKRDGPPPIPGAVEPGSWSASVGAGDHLSLSWAAWGDWRR